MLALTGVALAMLTVGLVKGQSLPTPPATLSPGETPISTVTMTVGGGVAAVPIYSPLPTPSPTFSCWRSKDWGAGVTGSLPVPTYVVTSGSIGYAAGSAGVHCYEVISTGGGLLQVPVPTAPPDNMPSASPTPVSASSNNTSLRVLLPSIIVPICSVALIVLAAILLRRRVKAKGDPERKWTTLKEEETNMSENGTKIKPTNLQAL